MGFGMRVLCLRVEPRYSGVATWSSERSAHLDQQHIVQDLVTGYGTPVLPTEDGEVLSEMVKSVPSQVHEATKGRKETGCTALQWRRSRSLRVRFSTNSSTV